MNIPIQDSWPKEYLKRINTVKEKLNLISKEIEKAAEESISFEIFIKTIQSLEDEVTSYELQLSSIIFEAAEKYGYQIKWGDIPNYGDLMPLETFKENCLSNNFINYDGFGYYATKNKKSNITIYPSEVVNNIILTNDLFTHVVWFNR